MRRSCPYGLTYPDGVAATASYTALEQLSQVKLGSTVAWTDTYDGLGRLYNRTTGNGHASYFLHGGAGELDLSSVQNFLTPGAPSGNAILYSYTYNGAHQVTSTQRQSYNSAPLAHLSASSSVGYGAADGLNRLPGLSAGPAYAYDGNGNQTSDRHQQGGWRLAGGHAVVKSRAGQYDAVVANDHDQGHIPVKLLGFEIDPATGAWTELSGVNAMIGLPIIRTSVGHGTAFDIAGREMANERSLLETIECVELLAG